MEKRRLEGVSSVNLSICQFAHSHVSIFSHYILQLSLLFSFTFTFSSFAEPIREWDWHMPGEIYKTLEFSDRAGVDRAVKLFQQAIDAERRGTRSPDLIPRYRAAAVEWRKIQVKGEADDFNAPLLAYAVFMQGYSYMQARDRNKAMNLFNEVLDLYPEQKFISVPARYLVSCLKRSIGDVKQADEDIVEIIEDKGADGHPVYALVFRGKECLAAPLSYRVWRAPTDNDRGIRHEWQNAGLHQPDSCLTGFSVTENADSVTVTAEFFLSKRAACPFLSAKAIYTVTGDGGRFYC